MVFCWWVAPPNLSELRGGRECGGRTPHLSSTIRALATVSNSLVPYVRVLGLGSKTSIANKVFPVSSRCMVFARMCDLWRDATGNGTRVERPTERV